MEARSFNSQRGTVSTLKYTDAVDNLCANIHNTHLFRKLFSVTGLVVQ